MLSFPRKLLFGDQSKLDFKLDKHNGIARLYSERHIPYHDSKYWSAYLQFDSPNDIFSLLSITDLRKASDAAPENVVTLVRVLTAHLQSLRQDPQFSPPPSTPNPSNINLSSWKIPGVPLSASSQPDHRERDRTREALNVVRILTRTLPVILEHKDLDFESRVLWAEAPQSYEKTLAINADKNASSSPTTALPTESTESQFVIDDEDDDADQEQEKVDHPLAEPSKPPSASPDQDPEQVPVALGERLIRLTIDLLFCSGFTIPWTDEQLLDLPKGQAPDKIHYAIWEAGVGSSVNLPGTTRQHVSNRVEVLRLLLVLLSKGIYIPAEKQLVARDPALPFTVQELERGIILPLMCSLLNTSVTNANNSTSAWLGLPNVGGIVGSNDEVRSQLVTQSLQVLVVLLGYEPPVNPDADTASLSTLGAPQPGPGGKNVFRFYLSKLHRSADFDFIWKGISKSLTEHISSSTQILAIPIPAGAGRRAASSNWYLSQVAERLMLLWRLFEHNEKFRTFVLDHPQQAPELLSFLLYFSLTYKDNLALQGLVRLCAFMLQHVSSERAFSVNLAKPGSAARVQIPGRLGLVGGSTAIDYLIQGAYALIATTKGQLSGLYPPLAIALCNTAPFWRSVSITSSTRIIHLLRSFSQPGFLLSDEGHPRLLYYLLETINAVLTFQYNANPNLVYAFILAHKIVDGLERFTLRRAVEEVWKKRRSLGTDTRDWFENATRLEKPPLPPSTPSTEGDDQASSSGRSPSAVEKGKMRRISTSSAPEAQEWEGELAKYTDETIEDVAARFIGKNGFRPTQEWVESWRSGLPLHTLRMVIDKLLPDVERIAKGGNEAEVATPPSSDVDQKVLAFLREQEFVGYLAPPSAGIRKCVHLVLFYGLLSETEDNAYLTDSRPWQWTGDAIIWLRSYLWGTIYVSALLP